MSPDSLETKFAVLVEQVRVMGGKVDDMGTIVDSLAREARARDQARVSLGKWGKRAMGTLVVMVTLSTATSGILALYHSIVPNTVNTIPAHVHSK